MTELRVGDEFMVDGVKYMLDTKNGADLVIKRSRAVPTLLGLTPSQYALMSNVLHIPVPSTVSEASRFIAKYKYVYSWPPSDTNGLSYSGQIDNIVDLFLNAAGSHIR